MRKIAIVSSTFLFVLLILLVLSGRAFNKAVVAQDTDETKQKILDQLAETAPSNYLPDQIIVKYRSYVQDKSLELKQTGIISLGEKPLVKDSVPAQLRDTYVVKVRSNEDIKRAVTKLLNNPDVEYAEPDYVVSAFFTPNDPYLNQEWGVSKIQDEKAWDITQGNPSVVVAVLDTGGSFNHPDLQGKYVSNGYDFINNDNDARDDHGHGTHTSGIVAAATNNGTGVASTGFNIKILPVKVLNAAGSGTHSQIAQGITYAANNGAKIISMSLGGGQSSATLESAVNSVWNNGLVIVAAAGNENTSQPMYPASYEHVISVSATDSTDRKASFSNYGSTVDVGAPGVSILSTVPGTYQSWNGTSMATPFVAGLAGLVYSVNTSLSNQQVRTCIEGNVDVPAGWSNSWGKGRINAFNTVTNSNGIAGCPLGGGAPTATPSLVLPTATPLPSATPWPSTSPGPSATPPATPTSILPTTTSPPTLSPTPSPIVNCTVADLNSDGRVDQSDLNQLMAGWGSNRPDLNGDNIVNGADIAILLLCWTQSPTPPAPTPTISSNPTASPTLSDQCWDFIGAYDCADKYYYWVVNVNTPVPPSEPFACKPGDWKSAPSKCLNASSQVWGTLQFVSCVSDPSKKGKSVWRGCQ